MPRAKKQIKNEKVTLSIFDIISCNFKNSAMFLMMMMTLVLIITNLLFVCKIGITKFHLPILYVISIAIWLLIMKKKVRRAIMGVIIATLVFFLFSFVSGKIYDMTADGNTYHKLAVGALKNGWNPIYQSVGDFHQKQGNPFDILEDNVNVKWVDHYARGTETFGAVVYAFSENIETGKVFNILWVYIGLFILYGIFRQMKIAEWKSILLAMVLACNPISFTQLTNYYLDGVLAISLFMIILICALQTHYEQEENKLENYGVLAMAIIWCVNVKFTGFAFAAVFAGILYLYRHIHHYHTEPKSFKAKWIYETVYYLIVVFLSVVVVGGSTYTKNFINHGHPFYPLYGKGHVPNMVMMEIPKSMQKQNRFQIFLTGIFSKGENVSPSYADFVNDPDFKIPFTVTKSELKNYNIPDIRVGGFGPLFSGIFLLTVLGTIYVVVDLIRNKKKDTLILYSILLLTTLILVLGLDGSYWARYIPYLYLLPIYVLIYIMKCDWKYKMSNILSCIMIGLFLLNAGSILIIQAEFTRNHNAYIKENLSNFQKYAQEKDVVFVRLEHHGIQGVQYTLDDLGIDNYKLTEEEKTNIGYFFQYE